MRTNDLTAYQSFQAFSVGAMVAFVVIVIGIIITAFLVFFFGGDYE